MIEIDKPISEVKEDLFSRVDFVKSVAEHIKNNQSKDDCTVIGIYGSWGAGKSSILKLLKEELKNHNFYTSQFNPWKFSSEDGMLMSLFQKMHEGAKSDEDLKTKLPELGDKLLEYQELIIATGAATLPIDAGVTVIISKFLISIGNCFKKKTTSIEKVKDNINEILQKLVLPLVIFVDDIDRLDNTEIRQLFKLLKLTADFKNLIYIVAFDNEVVSNVLNADYLSRGDSKGGEEFLEKIINIPLRIPYLSNQIRHEFLVKRLQEYSSDFKVSLPRDYEFTRSLRDCSIMLLKTPRDVKRVINSISFLRACLKNEVSFNDLIILEILRLYAHDVFSQIVNFQDDLFNKSLEHPFEIPGDKSKTTESGGYFFSKIDKVRYKKTEIISTISYLFPFNTLFSSRPRPISEQYKNELSLQNRVAVKNNFERYLKIGLLENELSSVLLDSILENINTKELEESLNMVNDWNDKNFNQIFDYLKLNEESFTSEGKAKVYQIYCISDYFNQGNEIDLMMGISPIHHVIKNLSSLSKLDTFLTDTIQRITSIFRKVYLISLIKDAIEEDSQLKNHLELINTIALVELKKILESDISVLFDNPEENKIHYIYKLVNQLNLRELFTLKVFNYINETGEILKVARSIKQKIYSFGSSKSRYDDEVTDDYFKMLEEVVNREVLVEEFNKLKDEYPLDYVITDEIKNINGIIIHKYLDYVDRPKRID
jgi:predicted KAP-like P-loop ATPase